MKALQQTIFQHAADAIAAKRQMVSIKVGNEWLQDIRSIKARGLCIMVSRTGENLAGDKWTRAYLIDPDQLSAVAYN